jgi:hypothetical protein
LTGRQRLPEGLLDVVQQPAELVGLTVHLVDDDQPAEPGVASGLHHPAHARLEPAEADSTSAAHSTAGSTAMDRGRKSVNPGVSIRLISRVLPGAVADRGVERMRHLDLA